jgi:hypothetical protein
MGDSGAVKAESAHKDRGKPLWDSAYNMEKWSI